MKCFLRQFLWFKCWVVFLVYLRELVVHDKDSIYWTKLYSISLTFSLVYNYSGFLVLKINCSTSFEVLNLTEVNLETCRSMFAHWNPFNKTQSHGVTKVDVLLLLCHTNWTLLIYSLMFGSVELVTGLVSFV